jgi:hypothetical protein
VGGLIPGEKDMVAVIRDRYGVIQVIPTGDLILVLNWMIVPGLMCSTSGNRVQLSGSEERVCRAHPAGERDDPGLAKEEGSSVLGDGRER